MSINEMNGVLHLSEQLGRQGMIVQYSGGSTVTILSAIFPYGMRRNPDGTWTFFNRQYQPLGPGPGNKADLDNEDCKWKIDGLTEDVIRDLSYNGSFDGHMIHFYVNSISPYASKKYLGKYLEKISILMSLKITKHG